MIDQTIEEYNQSVQALYKKLIRELDSLLNETGSILTVAPEVILDDISLLRQQKEKLEEMILHVAHYSGFPTGVSANQILNEIISDLEKEK